jgi:hypothetical protein
MKSNPTGPKIHGFVAQEAQKIFPDMVSKDELTGMFGVSSANLIPVLTKAVQELKAENDQLKVRLEALEAKVGK